MNTLSWILLYGAIIFFELPAFIKPKKRKELITYSIFIGLAFILTILLAFGVKIPSIDGYIGKIAKSMIGGK